MAPKTKIISYKFSENIFIGNADDLWDKVQPIFDNTAKNVVVFDMENVRICDSHGIRFLLNCQRRAESCKKKLVLLKPDRLIREMFKNIRLDTVFKIVDKLDSLV